MKTLAPPPGLLLSHTHCMGETGGKDCVKKIDWSDSFLVNLGSTYKNRLTHTDTHMHAHCPAFCSLNMRVWAYSVFPEIIHSTNLDQLDCFLLLERTYVEVPHLSLSLPLSLTQTHAVADTRIKGIVLTFWDRWEEITLISALLKWSWSQKIIILA